MKPATLIELSPRGPFLALIAGIALASVIAAVAVVAIATNRDQLRRLEAQISTFKPCKSPAQKGDQLLIKVRHDGLNLVITCQPLTDWRNPERITP